MAGLEGGVQTPAWGSTVDAARHLLEVEGFVPPSWMELSLGAPPPREMEDSNLAGVGGVARGSFRKAGNKGTCLMPVLFSLGQHPAFEAETICAFFFVALIEWCLFSICSNVSWIHSRIDVHLGKTQVWASRLPSVD